VPKWSDQVVPGRPTWIETTRAWRGCRYPAKAHAAGAYAAFATHDGRLIRIIAESAREYGLAADGYEFQMLQGIRPELHRILRELGVRLRVLVPFGEDWYGYFVRRLAERPAQPSPFAVPHLTTRPE
jgi:proline dehydrogenase